MLKKISIVLSLLFLIGLEIISAQVTKNIIVEHFTNSRCGTCANRNPGFYNNLDNHPEVLHLSVHPSSPYSNCELNLNNPTENDARTNFYGIYGSTPKLVIQGTLLSVSTNYGTPTIFEPYLEQTSPASIDIQQTKTENTVSALVTVTTEQENDLGDLNLFIALAEDSVFYDAPNGEDLHQDVYRKNMSEGDGFSIALPIEIGGTSTVEVSVEVDAAWDFDQLYTIAILQDAATKEVIQTFAVSSDMNVVVNSNENVSELEGVSVFPNPTKNWVTVSLDDETLTQINIFDTVGRLVAKQSFARQTTIDLTDFVTGIYLIEIENKKGKSIQKIIKD